MQAALVTGKGRVEVLEFAEPRPGQAVVRVAYCGVCGTDIHAFQSGAPYNPAICGHEWTGVVTAAAADVTEVREGDRVVGGIAAACGHCGYCLAGATAYCVDAFLGVVGGSGGAAHGGFAPELAVSARRLALVPAGLSDIEAALTEPLAVALHATRKTRIRLGDTVVVLGAGPIGLLTLQCARAAGGRVIAVEPDAGRAALARKLGASLVLDPNADDVRSRILAETGGIGPEVVMECAGISPTIQQAVDLVRRGGWVTLVGLSNETAVINPSAWLTKEVTFAGAVAYLHEEFAMAMALIADRRVDVTALHTATFPLSATQEAFESLAGAKTQVKVLIDPHA